MAAVMPTIRPFAALRYNPERITDLSQVISPPYDVIGPELQEQLYQRSPFNIVRLILGTQAPTDTPTDNRYTRAQRDFAAWRQHGILRQDARSALYLVDHAFQESGQARHRLGFVALLQLEEQISQHVYRHEATLSAPKEDRTKLLEAVPANLEPIFCVFPDASRVVQALLEAETSRMAPLASATINGESVRIWALVDPTHVLSVTRTLASAAVLIADGHHRFEVAYANRRRSGALMTYFVSMQDPALVIKPIHRVVHDPRTADLASVRRVCQLEPASAAGGVLNWLEQDGAQGRFGYTDGRHLYRATVKPQPLARWLMAPTVPVPVAGLDVSILHGLILPQLGAEAASVRYTADAAQAAAVKEGSGWLLQAIPLRQVYALAAQGFTMPPKSTYFIPKVPSGLTINLLE